MSDRPVLLLTRPKAGSERFADQVRGRFGGRFDIMIAPLQRIDWLDFMPVSEAIEALVFTSQNGVLGWNRVCPDDTTPAYCVGPQTARAAQEAGHETTQAGGDAEALIDHILARNPTGPLLHIRGEHARGQVAKRLTRGGIPTTERVAYRQTPVPFSAQQRQVLENAPSVIAPVFSPRSVTLLQEALPRQCRPFLAVISPNAAERVDAAHKQRMMVSKTPDAEGMLDSVEALMHRVNRT